MKSALFCFLSSMCMCMILPTTLLACQVTLNGEDKTNEFFIIDSIAGESYVDCMGHSKCRDAIITNCPVIKCFENEACNSAQIINFTNSVLCEGLHACHRTEMIGAASTTTANRKQTVSCIGSGACDVAHIVGENLDQVSCSGVKSCRKVHIEGAKLVKCHDGHDNSPACEGFATLETECLYCGKNGCADHINMCRYKIIGESGSESESESESESDRFEKCQPEQLIGNCPAELESELHLELSGKEEIDVDGEDEDGSRRMRRGLRA